jgi:hypothetical protein
VQIDEFCYARIAVLPPDAPAQSGAGSLEIGEVEFSHGGEQALNSWLFFQFLGFAGGGIFFFS